MTLVAEKKNKNEQTLPLPPDQQSSGGMKKDIIKVFFMVLSLIPGKLLPSFVRFFFLLASWQVVFQRKRRVTEQYVI